MFFHLQDPTLERLEVLSLVVGMGQKRNAAHVPLGFTLKHTLEGHLAVITRLSWAPDEVRLASAGQDGVIRIWNSDSGKLIQTLAVDGLFQVDDHWLTDELQSAIAWTPAWSKDGRLLACGYGDGAIRLWDTSTGTVLPRLEGACGEGQQRRMVTRRPSVSLQLRR